MTDIETYEIDDQFDPLEDLGFDEPDEDKDYDYQIPIPDAELSKVEPKVDLPPKERIEKLLAGMPGQKHRILYAIELCETPKILDEVVEMLDEAFPTQVSVYDSAQVVKLLERAGALKSIELEAEEDEAAVLTDETPEDPTEEEYLSVGTPPVREYTATAEGLEMVELYSGEKPLLGLLMEDERYLPIYQRILEMTSVEGGCPTSELDAVIDVDPLCENPRRFCTYFLSKLEGVGAIQWQNNWIAAKSGTQILESDLFTERERS